MRLSDMTIGSQLRLGLGLILLLVVGLGILSLIQADRLWLQTSTMYDHPLKVQRAVSTLEGAVDYIPLQMRNLLLARDRHETEELLQHIVAKKVVIDQQLAVMYKSYLGPRSDLDRLQQEIAKWHALREETIRLLRAGNTKEAIDSFRPGGVLKKQADLVRDSLDKIDTFARNKADQLYRNAARQKELLQQWLAGIVTVVLLLSLAIIWLLLQAIKTPLAELHEVTKQFSRGRMDVRSQFATLGNEFGTLAASFNSMADTIQAEMNFQEHAAELKAVMLQEIEARRFHAKVLEQLMQLTGSQVGAIYLLNGQKTGYEHLESIGLASGNAISFSATDREGEFGAALTTCQVQRITAIPLDTPFAFAAVAGQFVPREIITIPLLVGDEVLAMISLASLHGYDAEAVRLVTDMRGGLAVWMSSMLANQRIQLLTEGLERQNQELQAQQEELRVINEELEEQTKRLQESEEQLKIQQEELKVTNEELEEKNDLLEHQKQKVERARMAIEEQAAELAQASRYKSEFLANMSHELRTPLNSLLLLAHNLTQNRDGNLTAEQVESARIIHGSGSDLLTLINEILDLSKIEAGRIELHPGRVLISELADAVRGSFQHLAEQKGVGLDIVVSNDAPHEIVSDRKRVDQILRNLVSNALKFTETGVVTVRFAAPSSDPDRSNPAPPADIGLAVAVSDTGIGIAPEQHKLIFEAFQQADGGTSRKYGGTGLGLSISRELASRLGGKIVLKSIPNAGSTFTLYLPHAIGAERPSQLIAAAEPLELKTAVYRQPLQQVPDDRANIKPSDRIMLVIEDDPNFARLLYDTCRKKGFSCLVTSAGEQGLELAAKYLPSAIILDLNLPGLDGWSVLNTLKENLRTRHIPVHIISVEEPSTRSFHKGAIGHLTKPVNQEDLEEAFRKLEVISTKRPKYLLVVEDDPVLRQETIRLIGNGDVKADEAGSAEEAMQTLRSKVYDCVVLDLGLPDMDGGEMLARLEQEGVTLPPVVVYTSRDLTQDEEETLRERAESIVIKDVRSQERLLDEVSLFMHRVVSQMPEQKRKVIQDLHDTDTLLQNKKVLVVDDDMRTTFAIAHLLAEYGMKPLKAANGEKALRLLREQPDVDLVLMDIMMPVMDGYETIRQIRVLSEFRQLPIIALTAKAMPEDREKCLTAGANDYLPKPLDQGRLFSMMRVWLCR